MNQCILETSNWFLTVLPLIQVPICLEPLIGSLVSHMETSESIDYMQELNQLMITGMVLRIRICIVISWIFYVW